MQKKTREFWSHRVDAGQVVALCGEEPDFDYGPLGRLPRWEGEHPRVMRERIGGMDWQALLRDSDVSGTTRRRHRDERWLYRLLTTFTRVTGVDLNHKNHGRLLEL
jgi:hypothetical protein